MYSHGCGAGATTSFNLTHATSSLRLTHACEEEKRRRREDKEEEEEEDKEKEKREEKEGKRRGWVKEKEAEKEKRGRGGRGGRGKVHGRGVHIKGPQRRSINYPLPGPARILQGLMKSSWTAMCPSGARDSTSVLNYV